MAKSDLAEIVNYAKLAKSDLGALIFLLWWLKKALTYVRLCEYLGGSFGNGNVYIYISKGNQWPV